MKTVNYLRDVFILLSPIFKLKLYNYFLFLSFIIGLILYMRCKQNSTENKFNQNLITEVGVVIKVNEIHQQIPKIKI